MVNDASIQSYFHTAGKDTLSLGSGAETTIDLTNRSADDDAQPSDVKGWRPRVEYREVDIKATVPGPGRVHLTGRVANFYHMETPSKSPQAAKGCWKVIVKDDTGAIEVKLWYAETNYGLRLGQLVSLWIPHVSHPDSSASTLKAVSLTCSIFPERDNSCYFLVQDDSDDGLACKLPLEYGLKKQYLKGLETLKAFVEGGHDTHEAKILVCVKSVGGRKKITTKKGPAEKLEVNVFDHTAEATLTLWNALTPSATPWKPSQTVLLLKNPSFKNERRPTLSINGETHVDVDPDLRDAEWLREYAQKLTKREHVNPEFPEGVFDMEGAQSAQNKILFSLAELDELVRAAPHETFVGYVSVLILELHISRLHQRSMLCCTECCGVPLYANTTSTPCKQCDTLNDLRLNPKIIGLLITETGSLLGGKLLWHPNAWTQLLGRAPTDIVAISSAALRALEQSMLYLRITLMVGWAGEQGDGRLAVLGVSE